MKDKIYNLTDDIYSLVEKGRFRAVCSMIGIDQDHIGKHIGMGDDKLLRRIVDSEDMAQQATTFADERDTYFFMARAIDNRSAEIQEWLGKSGSDSRLVITSDMGKTCGTGISSDLEKVSSNHLSVVLDKTANTRRYPWGFKVRTAFPNIEKDNVIHTGKGYEAEEIAENRPEWFKNDLHRTAFSFKDNKEAEVYYGERKPYGDPYIAIKFRSEEGKDEYRAFIKENGDLSIRRISPEGRTALGPRDRMSFMMNMKKEAGLITAVQNKLAYFKTEKTREAVKDTQKKAINLTSKAER